MHIVPGDWLKSLFHSLSNMVERFFFLKSLNGSTKKMAPSSHLVQLNYSLANCRMNLTLGCHLWCYKNQIMSFYSLNTIYILNCACLHCMHESCMHAAYMPHACSACMRHASNLAHLHAFSCMHEECMPEECMHASGMKICMHVTQLLNS